MMKKFRNLRKKEENVNIHANTLTSLALSLFLHFEIKIVKN